jgi:hypothetical protein
LQGTDLLGKKKKKKERKGRNCQGAFLIPSPLSHLGSSLVSPFRFLCRAKLG